MPIRFRPLCALVFAASTALSASAQQIEVPFDQSLSSIEVTLTISGASDTDSSPVIGSVVLDIEDLENPVQLVVLDLDVNATESIDHSISFGFLGGFTQSSTGVGVGYDMPGSPSLPASIVGGAFVLPSLDVFFSGMGTYNATGLVCSLLQDQGFLCNDMFDFGAGGVAQAQDVAGTFAIADGQVFVSIDLDLSLPFDPKDPSLGQIEIVGTVMGSAMLPVLACPGDCDGSGTVDFNDLVAMLFEFGNTTEIGCNADGSGTVDFNDLVAALFVFGPCP